MFVGHGVMGHIFHNAGYPFGPAGEGAYLDVAS